jgi:hypothetical protein
MYTDIKIRFFTTDRMGGNFFYIPGANVYRHVREGRNSTGKNKRDVTLVIKLFCQFVFFFFS